MPDAGVLATILLIVGLFLLALELMIPSFGMIGIFAAVCLVVSAWAAWQAWWATSPGFFWTYASFWVLGIPSVLGGTLFVLQNTSLGDHIVLRGPGGDAGQSAIKVTNRLDGLVGQIGTASSLLRPGGMVSVGGERFHAESPGMIIDADSPVEVVSIKGNRLVVRVASEEAIAASRAAKDAERNSRPETPKNELADTIVQTSENDPGTTQTDDRDDSGILDFEIPDN